jgi:hypothetical protein
MSSENDACIPLEADKSHLSLEAARDETHRKLFGQTIWSDVDAIFDSLPQPPRREAPEHEHEAYDQRRISAWSTSWTHVKRTEGLLIGALARGEFQAIVFEATTITVVPMSAWRRESCPPRPFAQPLRASPISPLARFNGRTLYVRTGQFRCWLRTLDAKRTRKVPSPRGRPPLYDWKTFGEEVASVLKARGVPSSKSRGPKWNKRAHLEEHMLSWCLENWGREPARSTMAPHLDAQLARF